MEKNEKGIDIISPKKLKSENIISSQMQKKEQIRNESKKQTNNKNTKKSTKKKNKKQNKKQNKLWKKIKKWLAALGIGVGVTTLAISAGEATKTNEPVIEKPNDEKDEFKEGLKVENLETIKTNKEKITEEIENLKTPEEVLAYLKNLYIEEYENKTGDTSLTTEDIEINMLENSTYEYKDINTREIITHGDYPQVTEDNVLENGTQFESEKQQNPVYMIKNIETRKTIDGMTYYTDENKEKVFVKAYDGNYYNEMKENDITVLKDLNDVIIEGMEVWENSEKDRTSFVEAVEKYTANQKENSDIER